jgi:integrase
MASITKRGPYQFQAQIRRKGYPHQQRTFETKREAEAWATDVESQMNRGTFVDRSEAERTTFGEALGRYARDVTQDKRGWETEMHRIKALQKHPLAARSLASLRSLDFANYRDERLKECSSATVKRELVIISHVFNTARTDWSLPIDNPIASIRKPQAGQHRERRLSEDEQVRLLQAADESKAATLSFCIVLALESGMRAGEIVGLRWEQIDLPNRVIRLDMTKNGDRRVVPLSEAAEAAIRLLPRPIHGGRLTKFYDSRGLSAAFRRACERAGITGLRFHDLRHEAASRLAPHMPVATLAKVMGWKTIQMAMRYYNPTAAELVAAVRAAA